MVPLVLLAGANLRLWPIKVPSSAILMLNLLSPTSLRDLVRNSLIRLII